MYESYFGFSEKPFSILPDANFLYLSKKHKLALTVLRYGLDSHALITVITGDIGCGKTTLLRKLIGEVSDDITIGLITNTHSTFGDPLRMALLAFDLDYRGKSKTEQYQILVEFMIDEYAQNRRTVLIVDEAQNLDNSALEELRMLSNINVDQHHVLQLVLVGQPELRLALKQPELKQFAQRVSADYHILPLEPDEIAAYIQHRLIVVDGDPQIFLPETYPLVHKHSKGVPRLINILCDTALVHAYGANTKKINTELIQGVIDDRESGVYFSNSKASAAQGAQTQSFVLKDRMFHALSDEERSANSFDDTSKEQAFDSSRDLISDPEWLRSTSERIDRELEKESAAVQKSAPGAMRQDAKQDEELTEEDIEGQEPTEASRDSELFPSAQQSSNFGSSESTNKELEEEGSKPWFAKVAVSALLILLAMAALYLYQNPAMKDAIVAKVSQMQTQEKDWLVEVDEYLKAGQLLEPEGKNAYVVLQQVLAREPENTQARARLERIKDQLFSNAMEAQTQGKWEQARTKLQSLLQIEPQNQRAQEALVTLSSTQEAERAQAQADAQLQDWLVEADKYLKADQLVGPEGQNAYEVLTKVLALQPDNAKAQLSIEAIKDILYSKAKAAQEQGNWDLARNHLQALSQIEPVNDRVQAALNTLEVAQETERVRAADHEKIQSWLAEAEKYMQTEQLVEPIGANAYENFYKVLDLENSNAQAKAGIVTIKDRLFTEAASAQAQGNWDQARNQLQSLLQIEPQSTRGQKALEELAVAQEAAIALAAARAQIQSWLAEADKYLQAEQLIAPVGANAYENYFKALEREPDNTRAQTGIATIKDRIFAIAQTAQGQQEWDLAHSHLQSLLQIDPQSERTKEALAALNVAQEHVQAQAVEYAQLQSWLAEADKYLKAGQLVAPAGANAYENYFKAFEREPDNSRAQTGIATIKDQIFAKAQKAQGQQEWDLAHSHLQSLLQIDPQSERTQEALAALNVAQEQAQDQAAEQALLQSWLVEADKYLKAGQLVVPVGDNAYENYFKALEREPDNTQAKTGIATIKDRLFARAASAQEQGNWDQAHSQLQSLLQIEPQSTRGQKALEELAAAQESATELVSARAQIQSWLAEADKYLQAEQLIAPAGANAYENYFKALEREPDNTRAQAGIATIKDRIFTKAQTAQGQQEWDLAHSHLQSLLQIDPQSERAQEALAVLNVAQEQAQAQAAEHALLQSWLNDADKYLQVGQLIDPAGTNAYENYLKALEREPGNARALAGIVATNNKIFAKAEAAQTLEEWQMSRGQLLALLQYEPQNQRIKEALSALMAAQTDLQSQVTTRAQIQTWLVEADKYLQLRQWVKPVGANAFEVLQQVLDQNPDHEQALDGVSIIKDQLYASAMESMQQGDLELARSQIWALLGIDSTSSRAREALAAITREKTANQTATNATLSEPSQLEIDHDLEIDQDLIDFLKSGGEEAPTQATE